MEEWLDTFICQYQMEDTACCAETISRAEQSIRWGESQTGAGVSSYLRDSNQLQYMAESPAVEHEPILLFAQNCLNHYLKERKQARDVPQFGMPEGYNILRYKPDEAYHAVHSDAGWPDHANRHVTFGMFLNTLPKAGELEFPMQGIKVAPVEGRAVIFPAAWMYAHRSLPATVDRYVFNIFYGFLTQP